MKLGHLDIQATSIETAQIGLFVSADPSLNLGGEVALRGTPGATFLGSGATIDVDARIQEIGVTGFTDILADAAYDLVQLWPRCGPTDPTHAAREHAARRRAGRSCGMGRLGFRAVASGNRTARRHLERGRISGVAGLSRTFAKSQPHEPAPAMPEAANATAFLAARFASAGSLRRRGVMQTLADGVPEAELSASAASFTVSARRVDRPPFSDRALETASDEIRALAARLRRSGETRLLARADDLEEDRLGAALVLRAVGRDANDPRRTRRGKSRDRLALFDPVPGAEQAVAPLRDLGHLAMRRRRGTAATGTMRSRRAAALAALAALVVWLAWPMPRVITAMGLSRMPARPRF